MEPLFVRIQALTVDFGAKSGRFEFRISGRSRASIPSLRRFRVPNRVGSNSFPSLHCTGPLDFGAWSMGSPHTRVCVLVCVSVGNLAVLSSPARARA